MKIELFSSPLWTFDLVDTTPELAELVRLDGLNFSQWVDQQQNINPVHTKHYNFLDFHGYGTSELKKHTVAAIESIAKERNWTAYNLDLRTRHNVIAPGKCDTPHHHNDLDMVGIYYVECPPNSGDLLIFDTRGSVNMAWQDPFVTADSEGRTGRVSHRVAPQVGRLLMFPNYLFHSVETNLSTENRISVVMDIRLNLHDND
jgi:uncharacterized protein (TIGR02466 family)